MSTSLMKKDFSCSNLFVNKDTVEFNLNIDRFSSKPKSIFDVHKWICSNMQKSNRKMMRNQNKFLVWKKISLSMVFRCVDSGQDLRVDFLFFFFTMLITRIWQEDVLSDTNSIIVIFQSANQPNEALCTRPILLRFLSSFFCC